MDRLEIEHAIPRARGGTVDESNLWLSCHRCNRAKGDRTEAVDPETGEPVPRFHPRRQRGSDQFAGSADGVRFLGRAPTGRATDAALHLDDDPDALVVPADRVLAGWHPPTDVRSPTPPTGGAR